MHALPLFIALIAAAALAPPLVRVLETAQRLRPNYRGRMLAFPLGALTLAAALLALVPLALVQQLGDGDVFHPEALLVSLYALGVIALGLLDDLLGTRPGEPSPRGLRGHGAALLRGELSTGFLKAAGSLGLALFATSFQGLSDGRWLLASAVLVLATHLFNLLDLRPGRATKALVILGVGLLVGSQDARPLWSLGLFAGPALVAGAYDLRERGMLGDSGASLLGALAGLWMVLTLSGTGQAIALVLLAALTVYGELRSISALIERAGALRRLDSWGRPS
jgi:UDP-N-acetylmuramyl pentapeptide phosphotransferase/UDP-N-acetylglucosamine-1-phosphate transferase